MDHGPVARARTRRFGAPAAILYAGCALPAIAAAIGTSWPCELLSHFVAPAALTALSIAALCSLRRRWPEASVGGALALAYGVLCMPLYAPQPELPAGSAAFKVLAANLYYRRVEPQVVLGWIAQKRPDVLILLELTPAWRGALEPALSAFAHRTEILRDDAFGMGVYSRHAPIAATDVSRDDLPMLQARLTHAGRPVTLFAVHTIPPINAHATVLRDRQLDHVAQLAKRAGRNVIVAGDLNTTSWSPSFRRMLDASGLVDTRSGFGLQGSWHSSWPAPVRIPIDHILVSPDITTAHREVSPHTGSDHRAVFSELSLR